VLADHHFDVHAEVVWSPRTSMRRPMGERVGWANW